MTMTLDTTIKHRQPENGRPVIGLSLFCMGLLFAGGVEVLQSHPGLFTSMGPQDGLRLRMLRLAQIAAVALPLLTLLYEGLMARASRDCRLARWGWTAMVYGAIGLPAILTVASVTRVEFKFLLPFPAVATFAATACGTWLARQHARPLELWGWLFIAAGMAVGLLIGLYAFDGPLPPPAFIGAYNDPIRRAIRLGHAYAIVGGFTSIVIARATAESGGHARACFWR